MHDTEETAQGTGGLVDDDDEMDDTAQWDGTEALSAARQHLRENWVRGVSCPCCRQMVKLYRRKLDSSMASSLILVYRYFQQHPEASWLHLPRFLMAVKAADRECAKLRYWGLLEEMPKDHDTEGGGRTTGLWRITEKGKRFVEGKIAVPKYVYVFDGTTYKRENYVTGDEAKKPEVVVTIREALGDRFDYAELMAQ